MQIFACLFGGMAVYSLLSMGVITYRLPASKGGRTCIYGRFLWRGLAPAINGLISHATRDALFICPRRETAAEANNG